VRLLTAPRAVHGRPRKPKLGNATFNKRGSRFHRQVEIQTQILSGPLLRPARVRPPNSRAFRDALER
jgi:hypothetical protein